MKSVNKIMYLLLVITSSGLLASCSKDKGNAPDINSCYIEKDKLLTKYSKTHNELSSIQANIESEILRRTAVRQQELNQRVESYNQYISKLDKDNREYRSRLRSTVITILSGVVICIILVNVVLAKFFLKTFKPSKKIYEE